MASVILTHALLVLCGAIFVRLFTFRRGALRFSRLKSCGAWLVPGRAASTGESQRYLVAHSMMDIRGGGAHLRLMRLSALVAVFFSCLRIIRFVRIPV